MSTSPNRPAHALGSFVALHFPKLFQAKNRPKWGSVVVILGRAKNVLSVAMQCFSIAAVVGLLWMVAGYSLSFSGYYFGVIGDLRHVLLWDIAQNEAYREGSTIPEILFVMFEMTFAIITPAVMVGCYVERTKFTAVILMSVLWSLFVYIPVCHWVWGEGGWLQELGAMDFAGGLVVHTTAGVAALVIVSQLGRRDGFPYELQPPHNPGLVAPVSACCG